MLKEKEKKKNPSFHFLLKLNNSQYIYFPMHSLAHIRCSSFVGFVVRRSCYKQLLIYC